MDSRPSVLATMPLLPATALLAVGIVAGAFYPGCVLYGAAVIAALCFVALYLHRGAWIMWGIWIVLGGLTAYMHTPPEASLADGERSYVAVALSVDRYDFSQRIIARLYDGSPDAEVLLRVHSSMPVAELGDTLRFVASLRPVRLESKDVPFTGNLLRGVERFRVTAVADITPDSYTRNSANFSVTSPSSLSWESRLYRMRIRFSDMVFDSGISSGAAAFLSAVLTGDDDYIDQDTRLMFSSSGTAHVLALSGMHVAVIAFLVSIIFFPLRLLGKERCGVVFTLLVLWFYAFLTGLSPSVTRAVIMASVVMVGRLIERSSSPLNSLCLAAILILVFSPWQLFSPGFQLSFVAVAAIVMFAFDLTSAVPMWGVVRGVWQWVAVSFSAMAGTGVLAAWYFHRFPVLFILGNIPATLAMPFIMGAEMLNILFHAAGFPTHWLVTGIDGIYGCLVGCMEWIQGLSFASVDGIYFPAWLLVPYYSALVSAWIALRWRRKAWGVAAAILLMFAAGCQICTPARNEAEAFLVEYPYATVVAAYDGEQCAILTDAPPTQFGRIGETMSVRLRDFAGERGTRFEKVNPLLLSKEIYADSTMWCFGNLSVAVVGLRRNMHPVRIKPMYALVSARYFGPVGEVIDCLNPDTVVIATSVDAVRRAGFIEELDSLSVPYRIGLPPKLL